jgi:DNA polymerase-1
MKLIFDLETDDLLEKVTQVWCCGLRYIEGDADKSIVVRDNFLGYLDKANVLIGHNIIGFDLPVLKKLYGWEHSKECTLIDTWLLSKMLYPHRQSHTLAAWGETLGYPKGDHSDWTQYSEEMATYCKRDVDLTYEVYKVMIKKMEKLG